MGEWDTFTAVLRQVGPPTMVAQRVLPSDAREYTFSGLTPGRLYTITVTTNSENLSSSVSVTARTSMSDHHFGLYEQLVKVTRRSDSSGPRSKAEAPIIRLL